MLNLYKRIPKNIWKNYNQKWNNSDIEKTVNIRNRGSQNRGQNLNDQSDH